MALSQLQTREEGVVLDLSLENLKNFLVFRVPLIAVCSDITDYCYYFYLLFFILYVLPRKPYWLIGFWLIYVTQIFDMFYILWAMAPCNWIE